MHPSEGLRKGIKRTFGKQIQRRDLLGGVAQRMQSFFDQSFAKEAAAPANANNNINNNHHMNQPGSGMNI